MPRVICVRGLRDGMFVVGAYEVIGYSSEGVEGASGLMRLEGVCAVERGGR